MPRLYLEFNQWQGSLRFFERRLMEIFQEGGRKRGTNKQTHTHNPKKTNQGQI